MSSGMPRGLFITFEGIDGSGKTTQVDLLCRRLREAGHQVVLVRDPGGTRISERIREILLDRQLREMAPVTELLLYEAARAQLVAEKVIPALEAGKIVVSDRFFDSTTAYQGYGRGIELDSVRKANELGSLGLTPDLTVYIDVPVQEGLRRLRDQGGERDRLESEDSEFVQRVREGYLRLAEEEPERVVVLNGLEPPEVLADQVWAKLAALLDQRGIETG